MSFRVSITHNGFIIDTETTNPSHSSSIQSDQNLQYPQNGTSLRPATQCIFPQTPMAIQNPQAPLINRFTTQLSNLNPHLAKQIHFDPHAQTGQRRNANPQIEIPSFHAQQILDRPPIQNPQTGTPSFTLKQFRYAIPNQTIQTETPSFNPQQIPHGIPAQTIQKRNANSLIETLFSAEKKIATFYAEYKKILDSQTVPMQIFFTETFDKTTQWKKILSFLPSTLLGRSLAKTYVLEASEVRLNLSALDCTAESIKNFQCNLELFCKGDSSSPISVKNFTTYFEGSLLIISIEKQSLTTHFNKKLTIKNTKLAFQKPPLHTLQLTLKSPIDNESPIDNKEFIISRNFILLWSKSFGLDQINTVHFQNPQNFINFFKHLYNQPVTIEYRNGSHSLKRTFENKLIEVLNGNSCNEASSELSCDAIIDSKEVVVAEPVIFKNFDFIPITKFSKSAESENLGSSGKSQKVVSSKSIEINLMEEDEIKIKKKPISDLNENLQMRGPSEVAIQKRIRQDSFLENESQKKRKKNEAITKTDIKKSEFSEIQEDNTPLFSLSYFGVLPIEAPACQGLSLEDYQRHIFQKAVLFAFAARDFNTKKVANGFSKPSRADIRKKIREGKVDISTLPEDNPLKIYNKIKALADRLDFNEISRKCTVEIYTLTEEGYCLYKTVYNNGKTLIRLSMHKCQNAHGTFEMFDALQDLPLQNDSTETQALSECNTIPKEAKMILQFGILPLEIPPFTNDLKADRNTRYRNAILFAYAARKHEDIAKLAQELSKPENAELRKEICEKRVSAFSQNPLLPQLSKKLGEIKSEADDLSIDAILKKCAIEIYTAADNGYHHYKTINDQATIHLKIFKNENNGKFDSYDVLI